MYINTMCLICIEKNHWIYTEKSTMIDFFFLVTEYAETTTLKMV